MSLAETLALGSRRIAPAAPLDNRRSQWGEAQFRRQLDESNGDPIPAPVALHVRIPPFTEADGVSHFACLERQASQIGALLDPDRVPKILCLQLPRSDLPSTGRLADLIDQLRRVFARGQAARWITIALVPSRRIAPQAVESLAACGIDGLVIHTGRACTDEAARRDCVLCQTSPGAARDRRLEVILKVAIAEPSLMPLDLVGLAEADCTAKADRVIFIPPLTSPRVGCGKSRHVAPEHYVAAYLRACQRLESAGFSRRSPIEFARETAVPRGRPRPSWMPVDRHIGIGLGTYAQSYVNDWIFVNDPDLDRFGRSVAAGGLGVVYGTFLTAEERMRLGIIYDLLTRGVINLEGLGARHATGAAQPLVKNPERLDDLAARGIVIPGSGDAIEFAPHAILHTAEICAAFSCSPEPVRYRYPNQPNLVSLLNL